LQTIIKAPKISQ